MNEVSLPSGIVSLYIVCFFSIVSCGSFDPDGRTRLCCTNVHDYSSPLCLISCSFDSPGGNIYI